MLTSTCQTSQLCYPAQSFCQPRATKINAPEWNRSGSLATAAGPALTWVPFHAWAALTQTEWTYTHARTYAGFSCLNNTGNVLHSCDLFWPWGNLPEHTRAAGHFLLSPNIDLNTLSIFLTANSWLGLSWTHTQNVLSVLRPPNVSCAQTTREVKETSVIKLSKYWKS